MNKMKGFIVDSDYTTLDGHTYVQLFGRLENGQSFAILNKLKSYFFVRESDRGKMKKFEGDFQIEDSKLTYFAGEKVCIISGQNQEELNKLSKSLHKEEISTFEADIRPHIRFVIDNNLKSGRKPISNPCSRKIRSPKLWKVLIQRST